MLLVISNPKNLIKTSTEPTLIKKSPVDNRK